MTVENDAVPADAASEKVPPRTALPDATPVETEILIVAVEVVRLSSASSSFTTGWVVKSNPFTAPAAEVSSDMRVAAPATKVAVWVVEVRPVAE